MAGRRQRQGVIECLALLNMPQNLRDQQRLFDAGNDRFGSLAALSPCDMLRTASGQLAEQTTEPDD